MRHVFLAVILVALTSLAGCGSGGGGGAVVQRSIDLPANDLVYDPVSKRIYASIPSSAGAASGNSIAVINPYTASVERSVFVGSEPNRLAVSDDGQFLYVTLDGISAVLRLPLAAGTLHHLFRLEPGGSPQATDIAVLPGHPHTLVVAMNGSPGDAYGERVVVFDDGVQRPDVVQSPYIGGIPQSVVCSANGGSVFVFRSNGDYGLLNLSVTNAGLTSNGGTTSNMSVLDGGLQLDAGRIYSAAGHIVNASTLAPLGAFSLSANRFVLPGFTLEAESHRARYLFGGPGPQAEVIVQTFNTDTFAQTNQLSVPLPEFKPASELHFSRPARWAPGTAAVSVTNIPNDGDLSKVKHQIVLLSNLPQ